MKRILFIICVVLGFSIRLYSCFYEGHIGDMSQYMDWGEKTLLEGLANSYKGIYYPLQYHFFEFFAFIAHLFSITPFFVFKLANLPFDFGIFCLLLLFLKNNQRSFYFALLYWLNPWFLNNFTLGFVDTQYTFFLLLCVYLFKKDGTIKDYLVAGIPLGLAFVLKPQVVMIFFALFLLVFFFIWSHRRSYKYLSLFVPSVLFFLLYEIYFTYALYPSIYIESKMIELPSLFVLPAHYINVKNIAPCCLTASLMNLWYPIADCFREVGAPIYSVSSKVEIIPFISFGTIILLSTVLVFVHYSYTTAKRAAFISQSMVLNLVAFVSLFVPFFMTSAHYNHPYLGSVFLILIFAFTQNKLFKIVVGIFYLLLFINIFDFAGIGGLSEQFTRIPSDIIFYLSFISIAAFGVILYYLYRNRC